MRSLLTRRKRTAIKKKPESIQITPFVDVVLVLLIIFMITSPAVLSGIGVELPNGTEKIAQPESEADFVTVSISKNGTVYLNDSPISANSIVSAVGSKTGNNKSKTVFVRGDKAIKYGNIMTIVDTLNRAGYKKTILVTNSIT